MQWAGLGWAGLGRDWRKKGAGLALAPRLGKSPPPPAAGRQVLQPASTRLHRPAEPLLRHFGLEGKDDAQLLGIASGDGSGSADGGGSGAWGSEAGLAAGLAGGGRNQLEVQEHSHFYELFKVGGGCEGGWLGGGGGSHAPGRQLEEHSHFYELFKVSGGATHPAGALELL